MMANVKGSMGTSAVLITIMLLCCSIRAHADQVDNLVIEEMKTRQILGLQLAVAHQGNIVKLASFGSTDVTAQKPVSRSTLFPINSMTKAFTGTLMVKLVAMNKLSLSDSLGMHLEDLPNTWKSLTISQLLSHTSGLPNILTGNLTELVGDGTNDNAWQKVQSLPMQSQPDTQFSYNQTGYAILGKIIEKYFAQSYPAAVKSLLLESGMQQSAKYSFLTEKSPAVSSQFIASNGNFQPLELSFPSILWPAAGMASTAEELANFTIALQNEKFFDAKHLKILWQPRVLHNGKTAGFNERENGYAAGWQVIHREHNPAVSASGGNAVTLIIYPQEKLSIVVLTNVLGSLPIEFVDEIADYYLNSAS